MDYQSYLTNGVIFISLAIYFITIASCIVVVLSENRNPIRTLSWVIALIFLPVVGLIFYLFFGRSLKGMHLISRHNKRKLLQNNTPKRVDMNSLQLMPHGRQLVKLTHSLCRAPLTINNEIEIFTDGESKFQAFKKDLLDAKESILLQYYIFSDDELGNEIADILIAKAREGVTVKVIYDHVGSFSASRKFFKRMKDNGVDTHPFFRVTFPQLANRINWRNHRKIAVIDRKTGYIGGMNIASRYLGESMGNRPWRDNHLRIHGDIVESLMYSFVVDWNFLKKNPSLSHFSLAPHEIKNELGVQLITSGPTEPWDNLSLTFLQAISGARKCVYIQTPYFLPTDALLSALQSAALAKLDVRIMIPAKPDSKLLRYAGFSFVSQCLKAGIKVYLYNPGMLHSKVMIIDDDIVTTGSTNFDFRSFENNFECNLLIYDKTINSKMREIFFNDLSSCTKPTIGLWKKRPLPQRMLESLIRLFSPIL